MTRDPPMPCPATERLAELLNDRPAGPERDLLERHVDDCCACQQALLDLSGDATVWVRWERLLHTSDTAPEPSTEFLDRLKKTMGPRGGQKPRRDEARPTP